MGNIDKTMNVFISHFNEDEENIKKMKDLLSSKGYLIKNSSIDSTKPNRATNDEYIRRLLRMRIQWAGKFIVLIGPDTHTRPWVDWEIEQANKKGKNIIGVFIQGAKDSDIPENFKKYGDSLVGWNSEKIIGALNGDTNWENVSGQPWQNQWKSIRSNC
jgi:hypothetical protein